MATTSGAPEMSRPYFTRERRRGLRLIGEQGALCVWGLEFASEEAMVTWITADPEASLSATKGVGRLFWLGEIQAPLIFKTWSQAEAWLEEPN